MFVQSSVELAILFRKCVWQLNTPKCAGLPWQTTRNNVHFGWNLSKCFQLKDEWFIASKFNSIQRPLFTTETRCDASRGVARSHFRCEYFARRLINCIFGWTEQISLIDFQWTSNEPQHRITCVSGCSICCCEDADVELNMLEHTFSKLDLALKCVDGFWNLHWIHTYGSWAQPKPECWCREWEKPLEIACKTIIECMLCLDRNDSWKSVAQIELWSI